MSRRNSGPPKRAASNEGVRASLREKGEGFADFFEFRISEAPELGGGVVHLFFEFSESRPPRRAARGRAAAWR